MTEITDLTTNFLSTVRPEVVAHIRKTLDGAKRVTRTADFVTDGITLTEALWTLRVLEHYGELTCRPHAQTIAWFIRLDVQRAADVIASTRMEGGNPNERAQELVIEVVAGITTADEAIRQTIEVYNLPET